MGLFPSHKSLAQPCLLSQINVVLKECDYSTANLEVDSPRALSKAIPPGSGLIFCGSLLLIKRHQPAVPECRPAGIRAAILNELKRREGSDRYDASVCTTRKQREQNSMATSTCSVCWCAEQGAREEWSGVEHGARVAPQFGRKPAHKKGMLSSE